MPQYSRGSDQKEVMSVLITGGSGMIGRYLTSELLAEGYTVSHLSRGRSSQGKVNVYRWAPEREVIDMAALEGIDCIIHLAGANIGEKRWTATRKKEIVASRVESAKFLHKAVTGSGTRLKLFITASAIGIYGPFTSERIYTEEDNPADDFLGTACRLWEESADLFRASGVRTVKLRTSVVLEKTDSALSKLMEPGRYGLLVRTGSGRQYLPWIHISDLTGIYLKAVTDKGMEGAYNAVSPQHVTHNEFMKTLASVMKKPKFIPAVPAVIIKAMLGEMSQVVLEGSRVSPEKIIAAGYRFRFDSLEDALRDVIYNL